MYNEQYPMNEQLEERRKRRIIMYQVIAGIISTILCVLICLLAYPNYNVWRSGLAGQAELRRAEQNRQITIEEARAKKESAQMLADAEITRASGVAEANKIIGDSLKDNESYLRYLWIDTLNNNNQNVIYIPTEAGMPVLEAGKRKDITE